MLNAKFSQFHSYSSGRRHTYSLLRTHTSTPCPYNDGLKCVYECKAVSVCIHVWVCVREGACNRSGADVEQKPEPGTESNGPSIELTKPNIKDTT